VLRPRCIHDGQCLGHSAQGYITPCCHMDSHDRSRDYAYDIFYQEKFNINNNKDIKSITQSKEWIDFYTMLQERPEDAPPICKKICGNNKEARDIYG